MGGKGVGKGSGVVLHKRAFNYLLEMEEERQKCKRVWTYSFCLSCGVLDLIVLLSLKSKKQARVLKGRCCISGHGGVWETNGPQNMERISCTAVCHLMCR